MKALDWKRGDPLILAGTIDNPPRPVGGWVGYSLKAEAKALDSNREPTGAVLGAFTWTWPDRNTDAITLRLETNTAAFEGVEAFGFDVVLLDPASTPITSSTAVVRLLDMITAP